MVYFKHSKIHHPLMLIWLFEKLFRNLISHTIAILYDFTYLKHESVVYSCRTNLGNSNAQRISTSLRRIQFGFTAWYCSLFMCMVILGPVLVNKLSATLSYCIILVHLGTECYHRNHVLL